MSVIQAMCARCNKTGMLLSSMVSSTNYICTKSRTLIPIVCTKQLPIWEQSENPALRINSLQQGNKKDVLEYKLSNEDIWKSRYSDTSSKIDLNYHCIPDQYLNKEIMKVNDQWLPMGRGLFYNGSDTPIKCEVHTDKITTCHALTCSSPKNNTDKQSEGSQAGRPSEDTLEKTAVILAKELIKIFIAKPDYTLYRQDIVFENRISNKVLLI